MPSPERSAQPMRKVLRTRVAKLVRRPLDGVPNSYVISLFPLPFQGRPAIRRINAVLVRAQVALVCRLLRLTRPVIVVTSPTAWDVVAPTISPLRFAGLQPLGSSLGVRGAGQAGYPGAGALAAGPCRPAIRGCTSRGNCQLLVGMGQQRRALQLLDHPACPAPRTPSEDPSG